MLSPDQGYLGRSYVTLKNHKSNLSELSKNEWEEYSDIVKLLENACAKAFNAVMFNWSCLLNNAYQEVPAQPHVHWHFRPRYELLQHIASTTFNDPDFGHHYNRNQRDFIDDPTRELIVNQLRAALE